ncbi:MAG: YkgJ family cysteine cluster protein [Deltaproteobacteria bacterium]|nr:YkgJ family cysteine cluster protein [Deltaproteobacteria bacterium]
MPSQTIEILSEPRHVCKACGGSCQGNIVRLLDDAEEARIREAAETLGVEDAIADGHLRMEGGKCVFLAADNLCDIHRALGATTKPVVCQQYPMIAVRVEDKLRVGLDPGCYTSIQTWRDGPLVPESKLVASKVTLPEDQCPVEEGLLDLCSIEGVTVARVVTALTGEQPPEDSAGLPPAFAKRLVIRLQAAALQPLLDLPDTAPLIRHTLTPVVSAIAEWNPEDPPSWPALGPEEEAYAIGAMRRMLYLRLAHGIPIVTGVALIAVVGVITCAWATRDPHTFGAALAAWCRAMRAPAFWREITPDPVRMTWLARGRTPENLEG